MEKQTFVLVEEITNRLRLTRKYIRQKILPYVRHQKDAQNRVLVDEGELRAWLMENLSFTRQTVLVPLEEVDSYLKKLESLGIDTYTPPAYQRKKLPFRKITPFDIWDEPLLFPDDERFTHSEQFYRAMYTCGAVKIKIDERKTMFYAPTMSFAEPVDDFTAEPPSNIRQPVKDFMGDPISNILETKHGFKFLLAGAELFPAIPDAPEVIPGDAVPASQEVTITITGEPIYIEAIADAFRKISRSAFDNDERFQIKYSELDTTITIPNFVFEEWTGRKGDD